ncbi:MAG TPA: aldehyde dehydrogenase family protein [Acidimicrobiales bacterium]|nr:aldehyde dehydrogenase family protein [Acidimicrobiales bacterium]
MIAPPSDILPTGLLIGGEWVHQSSAGTMDHVYSATGQVQKTFPVAGPPEIDAAVAAARRALTEYRRWTPLQRRAVMKRIAALVDDHADEFATIATLECGMIQSVAPGMGPKLSGWLEYCAGWADKLDGAVVPAVPGFNYTRPEPFGVIAVILTWNGPTASIGNKVAPALAAGCTVVLKPPELAPFGSNLFARLCLEAGLPPGVVNVVPGGPDAGDALIRHPGVDKISFTGGPRTARAIQAACAESLTPLVLELGGKSPNLVFADADLERAANAAADGVTRLAGQICVAPSRLFVEHSVYDEVLERVIDRMAAIQVGDPFDPATTMGPLISQGACDRVLGLIEGAQDRGDGKLLIGGERLGGDLAGGFFVTPTAFGDVDNSSPIAQEEVFGPVLSIGRFEDEEEAIALANATPFGLAAYLHTGDLSRVFRVVDRLDAGNVAVNGGTSVNGPYAPFGGFKDSGYGTEGSLDGLKEFVRVKNVNLHVGPA